MWHWLSKIANPDDEVAEFVDSYLDGTLPELSGARAPRLPAWA